MNENSVITYNDMIRLTVRALVLTPEDVTELRDRITFIQDKDDKKLMTLMLDAFIDYNKNVQEVWNEQTS